MDRNSFISSFKKNILNRAPKAFMLFLVLVAIIECSISCFSPYIAGYSAYAGIKARQRVSQLENINREILIFGDSSAGVGINPQRLYEDTELPCANLATQAGTTIAANYFLLQNYLKFNDPPQQVILMRTFKGWAVDPGKSTFELLLNTFPEEVPELLTHHWLTGINYRLLLGRIPGSLLPSQRNRMAIRKTAWQVIGMKKTIPEVLTESQQKISEWNKRILGEISYDMGQEGTEKDKERSLLNQLESVRRNNFSVSPWKEYYLKQFISLAEQEGITIFYCLPPVRNELYEDEAGRRYLDSSKAFVNNIVDAHHNVVLLTDDFYFVTADQIRDNGNHLDAEESIIFTDMLAAKLSEFMESQKN